MSAVNWSEVTQKCAAHGVDGHLLRVEALNAGLEIVDLTIERAQRVAGLWPATKSLGLSLADRACLALAVELGRPAVTADRSWTNLSIAGLEISTLR